MVISCLLSVNIQIHLHWVIHIIKYFHRNIRRFLLPMKFTYWLLVHNHFCFLLNCLALLEHVLNFLFEILTHPLVYTSSIMPKHKLKWWVSYSDHRHLKFHIRRNLIVVWVELFVSYRISVNPLKNLDVLFLFKCFNWIWLVLLS